MLLPKLLFKRDKFFVKFNRKIHSMAALERFNHFFNGWEFSLIVIRSIFAEITEVLT